MKGKTMKYEAYIEDVEGNSYYAGHDIPIMEAATPWDAFSEAVDWAKTNNVMPQFISVEKEGKTMGKGTKIDDWEGEG